MSPCQQKNALIFQHWGIGQGLPQSTVNCIAQDGKGFVWFGTKGGLSRFDGYSFKTFNQVVGNENSLPSNEVNCVMVLPDNQMLIGTSNGLAIFDPRYERFYTISNSRGREIKQIKIDQRKNIWIGTLNGLHLLSTVDKKLSGLSCVPTAEKYSDAPALEVDEEGRLWVGYANKKVVCINTATNAVEPLPASLENTLRNIRSSVNVIKKDNAHNIWFGTISDGVIGFNLRNKETITIGSQSSIGPRIVRVRDILFAEDAMWIAARNGLFKVTNAGKTSEVYVSEKENTSSLSSSSICALLQDRSGVIWIGTYLGGVNTLISHNQSFTYFNSLQPDKGLNSPIVYSPVYDSLRNGLWIGTGGGGIDFFNLLTGKMRSFLLTNKSRKSVDYNYIESLCLLPDNKLLVGTLRGLFIFDPDRNKIDSIVLDFQNPIVHAIFSLLNDKDGTWIGTQKGLFFLKYRGRIEKWMPRNEALDSLSSGEIHALCKDRKGGLWIGRTRGLSYKLPSSNRFVNFDNIEMLSCQPVNTIYEDHTGKVWIGTDGNGLIVYDPDTRKFTSINRLLHVEERYARAIIEDANNNLWVSSINAIWKISFVDSRHTIVSPNIKMEKLSAGNGLYSNEFSRAVARLDGDSLFFGGYSGGVMFAPSSLQKNSFVAPVVITDFQVANQPDVISKILGGKSPIHTDTIILPYKYAYFSIQFAALNFINSNGNTYAYKMDGLKDDAWHYVGSSRQATYTNLAPGKYVFMVKAANNDGVWNANPYKLFITILPPIWLTWYAYLFYFLVFVVGLYWLVSTYKRTTQLKNELHLQHLRNEMDKEFVDKKINFYTNISHEIKTPLSLIVTPLDKIISKMSHYDSDDGSKMLSYLYIMKRNSEKLMVLIKQLLDYRRLESGHMQLELKEDDLFGFVKGIIDNFQLLAQEKNIDLFFSTNPDCLLYRFDADKMEQILNNLLSNAIKFTPEKGKVWITVTKKLKDSDSIIELIVKDNGRGIQKEYLKNLFEPFHHYDKQTANGSGIGLTYTKAIVEQHGGSISVDSVPSGSLLDGYTIFTIQFPLEKEWEETISNTKAQDNISLQSTHENTITMRHGANTEEVSLGNTTAILIVEDNADMLFFLSDHFEDKYKVLTAKDAEEGWSVVQNIVPDLIISDLMMPGMDGIAFCRLIKENTTTSHIPFILLTAKDTDESKISGFKTGADDYISKPFNINLLEVRVENLFANRQRLQERYQQSILENTNHSGAISVNDEFIQKIVDFVLENILEPELNVEGLSQAMNMSRITLYRKIKAITGLTAIEFIRTVRLQKAAKLLSPKRLNVNEVCYEVGFSDVDYFRKAFKAVYGVLPSEYATSK